MDGRGGCCVARYGCGGGEYDMSMLDMIMMKYRPIAPKPIDGGGSSPEKADGYVKNGRGRGRRRCGGKQRCKNNNTRKRKREEKTAVTLPLLPETPEPKKSEGQKEEKDSATWLSFESFGKHDNNIRRNTAVGKSCVTVDCVTDTWVDGDGLGRTDEEKRMNLERDTSPGFVSDGLGRVVWMNGAYKSMAGMQKEGEVMVWLVMKERAAVAVSLMGGYAAAFTCRVRVQYSGGGVAAHDRSSLTLPCDVWRMEGGGFAWRLDVKAALCLGQYGK